MRMARARRMTAVCDVTRNPSVGGTGVSSVVTGLRCTPALPLPQPNNWGVVVDYVPYEMTTADNANVQRFDVVTVDERPFSIEKMRRYPQRGFTAGYLSLLLKERG